MSEDTLQEPVNYAGSRKHSSGDLHSRLKTRKLLGVGETDDGDVHRSKLSQILGHSEQLYIKLPRGLKIWHFTLAVVFLILGIWAVLFPTHLLSFALHGEVGLEVRLPIRLYGAALLGLSVIFWSTVQATDKDVIRWSLLSSLVYFTIQIFVTSISLLEQGTFLAHAPRLICLHLLFGSVSGFYYWCIGDKITKLHIKKSASSKDLSQEAKVH